MPMFCVTPAIAVVNVVSGLQSAGARHVLHDDAGLAGNVIGEMAREQTRILVIAAARAETDHDADGLAFVELGRGLGLDAERGERADGERDSGGDGKADRHKGSSIEQISAGELCNRYANCVKKGTFLHLLRSGRHTCVLQRSLAWPRARQCHFFRASPPIALVKAIGGKISSALQPLSLNRRDDASISLSDAAASPAVA
jgi:hypothetical protein